MHNPFIEKGKGKGKGKLSRASGKVLIGQIVAYWNLAGKVKILTKREPAALTLPLRRLFLFLFIDRGSDGCGKIKFSCPDKSPDRNGFALPCADRSCRYADAATDAAAAKLIK